MECYNLSSYIDDIHGWCGNDLNNVITLQSEANDYGKQYGRINLKGNCS